MAHASILGTFQFDERHQGWILDFGYKCAKCNALALVGNAVEIKPQIEAVIAKINRLLSRNNVKKQFPPEANGETLKNNFTEILLEAGADWSPTDLLCFLISHSIGCASLMLQFEQDERFKNLAAEWFATDIEQMRPICPNFQIDVKRLEKRILGWELKGSVRDFLKVQAEPFVVLLVLADPINQPALRLLEEKRSLAETLRGTKFQDSFRIEDVPSCRPQDLQPALLKHQPRIIHFSGHGSRRGLVFEDPSGRSRIIQPENLAGLLRQCSKGGLEAVILNSCYSKEQAGSLRGSVDAIIAMDGKIDDDATIAFTRSFYNAFGEGRSLRESFEWGVAGAQFESSVQALSPVLIET